MDPFKITADAADKQTKTCTRCKQEKPLAQFYRARDGHTTRCKSCVKDVRKTWVSNSTAENKARTQAWKVTHPVETRLNRRQGGLKYRFNLTTAEYDQMLAIQNGVCAICGEVNPNGWALSVDHDHACCAGRRSCGKCLRDLLCNACNNGLGRFRDNPDLLRNAASYLERWGV